MSFALQWVSCRQRVIGSHFPPICYSVSFGALSLLTFDVIIDSYVFIAILNLVLSLILCFFFVPFFFYFSFCGMMIFSHIMLMFFFFNLLYAFDLRLLCQICKPLSISTYLRLVVSIGSNTFWGKKIYIFLLSTPKFHDFDVLFYIFFFSCCSLWLSLLHIFFFPNLCIDLFSSYDFPFPMDFYFFSRELPVLPLVLLYSYFLLL